ncbi:Hypothetical predicted protein [Scomber scombrus]|uniref:Uncharacterized protein n=1 Tax=Scomber scombrus TaxID=13677 RepID=A0AAV1PIG0_SCOSC
MSVHQMGRLPPYHCMALRQHHRHLNCGAAPDIRYCDCSPTWRRFCLAWLNHSIPAPYPLTCKRSPVWKQVRGGELLHFELLGGEGSFVCE